VGNGDSASTVYIHRSRLDKVSPWFKRIAAHSEVIELDHVSAETLQAFYAWVYDDRIVVKGLQEEMDNSEASHEDTGDDSEMDEAKSPSATKDRRVVDLTEGSDDGMDEGGTDGDEGADVDGSTSSTVAELDSEHLPWYLTSSLDKRGVIFGRLLDLYAFSVTYEVTDFKVAAVIAWQRFSYATSTSPSATVIRNICMAIPLASGLVQYLTGCYAYHIGAENIKKDRSRWKTLPSDFLTEVLILALGRTEEDPAQTYLEDPNEPNHRWCKYHDHGSEDAEDACRSAEGRQDDPDMVYEKRIRQMPGAVMEEAASGLR
jgi:hypothetical protein